jgi:hypothetical protein
MKEARNDNKQTRHNIGGNMLLTASVRASYDNLMLTAWKRALRRIFPASVLMNIEMFPVLFHSFALKLNY